MKIGLFVLLVMIAPCYSAFAADGATTVAAVSKTSATVIPANDGKWHTVLETSIKNPTADDDLFIDVSQVDTITTTDATSSATPNTISSGDAKLQMRVLVDGLVAQPGAIVFDEQLAELTSNLQRFLSLSCTSTPTPQVIVTTSCVCGTAPSVVNGTCAPPPAPIPAPFTFRSCTSQTTIDTDVVTACSLVPGSNQSLATLLSETLGHSFDFLATGVGGSGDTHLVQVQEMLSQTTSNGGGAQAVIGPTTLKISAVNLK
jgi:hypothetical protein